jgi:exonuclease SbcD
MRFIHTADWHLGRLFCGVHLTADQAHVLDQLVRLVDDTRPDALLVSGDIYDRAVPPPDAVELLDDTLCRLVLDCRVPVLMIAGNHDSPQRIGFGSRLLADRDLHVFGTISPEPGCVHLEDDAGPVRVYAVPYAEPSVVRGCLGSSDDVRDHDSAMAALCRSIRESTARDGERTILVAHAFVSGGSESESERPLAVGGAFAVDPAVFDGFNFVALGHLHRPQVTAARAASYAGSLLKYSFSEADHHKSVSLVEMGSDGKCTIERVPLAPRRDVRCVEGLLKDILRGPRDDENPDDYLMVRLLDRGAILDAMGKLREVYPNVLHIERPELTASGRSGSGPADHRRLSDAEMFQSFFRDTTGDELSDDELDAYTTVVNEMRQREREA